MGWQSPQRFQRPHQHTTAWPALLTEHRAPPSASYLKGPSQFHCVGAYTAAGELVAKSYGAGRTRIFSGSFCQRLEQPGRGRARSSQFGSLNHSPLTDLNAPSTSHCLRSAFGAKRKSTGSQNRLGSVENDPQPTFSVNTVVT